MALNLSNIIEQVGKDKGLDKSVLIEALESAMQKENQFRLAVRKNRRCSRSPALLRQGTGVFTSPPASLKTIRSTARKPHSSAGRKDASAGITDWIFPVRPKAYASQPVNASSGRALSGAAGGIEDKKLCSKNSPGTRLVYTGQHLGGPNENPIDGAQCSQYDANEVAAFSVL